MFVQVKGHAHFPIKKTQSRNIENTTCSTLTKFKSIYIDNQKIQVADENNRDI